MFTLWLVKGGPRHGGPPGVKQSCFSLPFPPLGRETYMSVSLVLVLDQHCPDLRHPAKGQFELSRFSLISAIRRTEASLGKSCGRKQGC